MANHDSQSGGHDHDSHGGNGKYWVVFGCLVGLTLISFFVGGNEDLKQNSPQVAWATMMAVSCGKALLVMLFFMHLKWEANWKYVLTIPATIMSIFLVMMLVPDVADRGDKYSDYRRQRAAAAELPHDKNQHDHDEDGAGDRHH